LTLNLSGLTVELGRREVLQSIDLSIGAGVTGLVGRNGAGKTTLMRTVCGVLRPRSGTIERDGQDIFGGSVEMRLHRRDLGWMPQDPGLPAQMKVTEFVTYAAWLKEIARAERRTAVEAAVESVDMTGLSARRLGTLSGGQRRRVALAAAIVGMPTLLLLDEPTNGLDPIQRSNFLTVVRSVAEHRVIILATHLLEDLSLSADSWFALDSGRIVGGGSIDRASAVDIAASLDAIRSSLSPSPAVDQ
jgi:ABC-2 type transport system ATP-binding protein